jgi:hypothetical protein
MSIQSAYDDSFFRVDIHIQRFFSGL